MTPSDLATGPFDSGDPHIVRTQADLDALYPAPGATSLAKEADHLTPAYAVMLSASPFCLVATSGPGGLDISPRGDAPGFVHIRDARTLILPDRRGNNRLDTLRNVIEDPRIALLFLVPGVKECLRVRGRAEVTADPDLLARFEVLGQRPATALRIHVARVYFQCARAIMRSGLWDAGAHADRATLPTAGQMTQSADAGFDAGPYDAALPARQAATLY